MIENHAPKNKIYAKNEIYALSPQTEVMVLNQPEERKHLRWIWVKPVVIWIIMTQHILVLEEELEKILHEKEEY